MRISQHHHYWRTRTRKNATSDAHWTSICDNGLLQGSPQSRCCRRYVSNEHERVHTSDACFQKECGSNSSKRSKISITNSNEATKSNYDMLIECMYSKCYFQWC